MAITKKTFPIVGMHCVSCAKSIEKRLAGVSGVVSCSVNFGSESATVEVEKDKVKDKDLMGAVKEAGYKAIINQDVKSNIQKSAEEQKEDLKKEELKKLKVKVAVSAILSSMIVLGSLSELFGASFSPFILWALASPVQFWAGREFYLAAWSGLKNRAAGMDTLIAIGTSAAYGYSILSLLGLTKGIYFDTAAVIITLILLGRFLEAKAK
ncbi:MAG: cation transporter, partial [bacterium]|nr:cation transporter [bacterium]